MEASHMSLKQYIQDFYIPYLEGVRTKPSSLKRDKGVLKIICSYQIANLEIGTINENDLSIFFTRIMVERNLSKATVNRYRSRLLAILNHAKKARIILFNPVSNILRYKEISRDRILAEDEMQALLGFCKESKNDELYTVVMLALYTGMRCNEILTLHKSAITGNIIKLKASETKSSCKRNVILNSYAIEILNDFIANYDNGDKVFKTKYIRRSFTTAVKRARLTDFHFHDLRRTFATYLLDSGANVRIIQRALGHSSLKMTEVYLASNLKKSIDALERLCFSHA